MTSSPINWNEFHVVLTKLYMHIQNLPLDVAQKRSSYAIHFMQKCVREDGVPDNHLQQLYDLMPIDVVNADIYREYVAETAMTEIFNEHVFPVLKTAAEEAETVELRMRHQERAYVPRMEYSKGHGGA